MIANEKELTVTLDRIAWFLAQVMNMRKTVANPANYRAAVSGFLAELDKMQREVREYSSVHPTEMEEAV